MQAIYRLKVTLLFLLVCLLHFAVPVGATPPTAPINVRLTGPEHPQVGIPFLVTFSVTPLIDAPQIRIIFKFPEGVDVVEGSTEHLLSMEKGETKEFEITVVIPAVGRYQFIAGASIEIDPATKLGANTDLIIEIPAPQPPAQQSPKIRERFKTKEGESVME